MSCSKAIPEPPAGAFAPDPIRVTLRRISALLIGLSIALLGVQGAIAPAVGAQSSTGVVPVVQVSGLLDPVLADYVIDAIDRGNEDNATVIVLQVDSRGSVLDDDRLDDVAQAIVNSSAPVTVWVGPSGARALGEVAQLVGLAERVGVAPGARLGETGPQTLSTATYGTIWGDNAALLNDRTLNHEQVIEADIAPQPAAIVGDFVLTLTDLGVEAIAVDEGTQISQTVRFERLGLLEQQLHTVASAPVAYLLFITGLGLFVFEFFTAGVGVAGIIGAGCFLLGSYGLGVLPTRTWAIVALVVAMFAFAVDVQTGVPRFWTAVGVVLFIIGSLWLFTDGISMSWITLVVGIGGMVASMLTGMPTMVRTRFSTPTIGRNWMVGELGTAVEDVSPDGVVQIRDALWKARTNRATPVESGGGVRVVAIDGLVLEVEPEAGGARDYRERD